jgi:RNA polymerase sigma-70 factor (ECF subfamily)
MSDTRHTDIHPPEPPGTSPKPSAKADSRDVLQVFLQQQERVEKRLGRWVSCRTAAADLCQELFIRLWRRRDIEVQDLDQYMMRSARNLAIDHLRNQGIRQRAEANSEFQDLESSSTALEDGHQAGRELQQIEDALRKLPMRTRHVFLLNRIHGQSYSQIASSLDLSVSAVEKHMMRALQACKHLKR